MFPSRQRTKDKTIPMLVRFRTLIIYMEQPPTGEDTVLNMEKELELCLELDPGMRLGWK